MLDLHFIFPESLKQFFLNIRPVNVNWFFNGHLNWNLNWNLSVNMDGYFTININWFVNINYFLCYCWNLNRLNYFFLNFIWYLFLNLYIFRNLDYLFYDSFRSRDWSWYLNQNLNGFLYHNFFDNFLRHNMLMSFDLSISIF